MREGIRCRIVGSLVEDYWVVGAGWLKIIFLDWRSPPGMAKVMATPSPCLFQRHTEYALSRMHP